MRNRATDLDRLYDLLDELRERVDGYRRLRDCHGRMAWPLRGVYFFFEDRELREGGRTPRLVRIGTHAVSIGSRTSLWQRLAQHRGTLGGSSAGGGNHRGSVFRLHVGTALMNAQPEAFQAAHATWGRGSSADRATITVEASLERAVSQYIGSLLLLWVGVEDEPGPGSERHVIEKNIIALVSNAGRPALDPHAPGWLGHHADRQAIRESGLWNVDFVYGAYEAAALDVLARRVSAMSADPGSQLFGAAPAL
jgi:hypothetical protein